MHRAHINIGSNLGDSSAYLNAAVTGIRHIRGCRVTAVSSPFRSRAWGYDSPNIFTNIGVEVETSLSPIDLLHELQAVERAICHEPHRTPSGMYADRRIDIDLITYGDLTVDMPELKIPHPRMHLREFVLSPLAEISPDWRHPLIGLTAKQLSQTIINHQTMIQISNRVNNLSVSQTLAMSQKSNELKAQGVDVINMSVGEPDFNTPDHIKLGAIEAVTGNYSRYTPVAGFMSLRKAIADDLNRLDNTVFAPEQIVVSNGAKQAISNVLLATINPGDEVIVPTPAWVSYTELIKLAEGVTVEVPAAIDTDFKITPAQLKAAITPRTRMLLLCSPSNPTGSVYTREELQALVDILAEHPEIIILADEIYRHINYTGSFASLATFPEIADRVVIINGVSKAYAMTGWRIGYCAAPVSLAKAVTKLQGQMSSNASSIAQKAAETAYTGSQDCVETMRKAFERRRELIVGLAREIKGWKVNVPQGAFYLFPEIKSCLGKTAPDGRVIATDSDFAMYILEEAHVAAVAGSAFMMPGYLRLSYATSETNIIEALARISRAVDLLI